MNELNEVKKIRAILGMTQRQLAQALGVTERSVKSWEAGGAISPMAVKLLRSLLAGVTTSPNEAPTSETTSPERDHVAALLTEIAEQRKLTAEAQRQTAQLLNIVQQLTERKP